MSNHSCHPKYKTSSTTFSRKGPRCLKITHADYWPIEPLSLCEEDKEGISLAIPTRGRYIRISSMTSQENGIETVLDAGDQQIKLNGRCLKVFYPIDDEL